MYDEYPLRRGGGGAEPADEPVGIGVGREAMNGLDVGSHRNLLTENPHGLRSVLEAPPARPRGLVPDEQHRGAGVGEALSQVVEHTPTGGHTAGRNDED